MCVYSQQEEGDSASSSESSGSEYEYARVKRRRGRGGRGARGASAPAPGPGRGAKRPRSDRLELRPDPDVEELLALVDHQLNKLDERLVKLLAWQQLQQVPVHSSHPSYINFLMKNYLMVYPVQIKNNGVQL